MSRKPYKRDHALQIRVTQADYDRLAERAIREKKTINQVVIDALWDYLPAKMPIKEHVVITGSYQNE